jgi:hypothetical protein
LLPVHTQRTIVPAFTVSLAGVNELSAIVIVATGAGVAVAFGAAVEFPPADGWLELADPPPHDASTPEPKARSPINTINTDEDCNR